LCRQDTVVRFAPITTIQQEIWIMPNMTATRELPTGYTDHHDSSKWNVGEVFSWSDVYKCWLACEVTVTVKPDMTIKEAFEDRMNHPMWYGYAVFFNSAFC
jgi:hypothetical protein